MEDSAAPYRQPELCGFQAAMASSQSLAGPGWERHWREGSEGPSSADALPDSCRSGRQTAVQATRTSVLGSSFSLQQGHWPP